MADVIINGNTYTDVPAVDIPRSDSQGTARFYDPNEIEFPVTSVNGQTGDVELTIPSASSDIPSDLGTASAGSSTSWSKGDHVHKMPSASDVGAIAAPSSASVDNVLAYDGSAWVADKRTVILSYGSSTWQQFLNAYKANAVIYCRASSNSNPATGSQTRMAFMAYVNNADNPTNVEFQYYRSVNQHNVTQQGDQVYVYKLDKTAGWTVTVRENYTRIVAGTGLTATYSNGVLTISLDS